MRAFGHISDDSGSAVEDRLKLAYPHSFIKKSKDNNCHQTREKGHQNYDMKVQKTQGECLPAPDVGCKRELQFPEINDHNSHHKKVSEDSPTTDPNETLNYALHPNLQVTLRATTEDKDNLDNSFCGTEENGKEEVDMVTSNRRSCSSGIETEIKKDSTAECGQGSSPNAKIHTNGVCPVEFNTSLQAVADGSLKDDITEEDVMAPTSIFDKVFQDHVNTLHVTTKTNDLEESHKSSQNSEQQLLHLNVPLVDTKPTDVELSTASQSEKIDDVSVKIGPKPVATYDDECISISSSDTEILKEADCRDIEMKEEEAHEDMEMHEDEIEAVVAERDVINVSASGDVRSQCRVKSNSMQEKTSKDIDLSSNSYVVKRLSNNSGHVETSKRLFKLENSETQEVLSVTAESDRSAANNSLSLLYNKSVSTSNMPASTTKAQSNQRESKNDGSSHVVKKRRISIAAGVVYYEDEVSSLAGSQSSTMKQTLLPTIQPFGISNPGTPTSFSSLPSIQPNGISNPGTPTAFLSCPTIQPNGISNPGTPTTFLSCPTIQPNGISNPGTSTSFLILSMIQPHGISNRGTPISFLSHPTIQPYGISNPGTPTSCLKVQSNQPNGIRILGTSTSFLSRPTIQPNGISNLGTPTSFSSLPSIQPCGISNPGTSTSFLKIAYPFVPSNLPSGSTLVLNGGSVVTKHKEQRHLSQNLRSADPSQEEPFSCSHCNMRFRQKSDLYHHKCTHLEERSFSCSTCKTSFGTREELVIHSNHPEGCREDIVCDICKKVFRISSSLKWLFTFLSSEKSSTHEGDTEVDTLGSSSISKPSPSSNRLEVTKGVPAPLSGLADDYRRTSSAYCSHIESMISSKVPSGSTLFNVRGLFRIKDKDNSFACGYCGKTYKLKGSLYGHIKMQHDEKHYSCEFCGKRYVQECDLLRHVTMHTQEKPFTCDQCGMQFRLKRSLRIHKLTHSEERLYPCDKCGKSFKTYNVLSKHKESHNDNERKECSICKRTFSAATNLKEHMRIHTGEKPIKCTLCGKQFRVRQLLHVHMNSHSGKKRLAKNLCSVCGKNVWNMPTHIRMHSGEKPFQCNICDKRFPKKINLERHMRSHTGEKPFDCSGCEKRFALYSNMMTHKAKCTALSENIA